MPSITYYVVLPFIRTPDDKLICLEAEEAPDAAALEFLASGKLAV